MANYKDIKGGTVQTLQETPLHQLKVRYGMIVQIVIFIIDQKLPQELGLQVEI